MREFPTNIIELTFLLHASLFLHLYYCYLVPLYRVFHNVLRDYKKIDYRKTVGHIFTKPVQIEGTTQFFSPQQVVFHRSSHFCS